MVMTRSRSKGKVEEPKNVYQPDGTSKKLSSSSGDDNQPATHGSVPPKDVKNTGLGTSSRVITIIVGALAATIFFFYQLYLAVSEGSWAYGILLAASGLSMFLTLTAYCVAYYAAGIAMCPPWYKASNPNEPLTQDGLPEYWQGVTLDPLRNLGIEFEDVEFQCIKGHKRKQRLVNMASKMRPKSVKLREEREAHSDITLRGWYVPANASAPTRRTAIVTVHGGGRDRRAHLRHTTLFHNAGYPVLLFDLREHGQSDGSGRGFSYGVLEQLDVVAAVRFARERSGLEHVVVVATSVGATATILAAAEDPTIAGVVAENPLTRPEDLITFVYWQGLEYALGPRFARTLPFRWLGRMIIAVFLWRIGALREDSLWSDHRGAVDVVHRLAPRPILLMHGMADKIIPYSHSQQIFEHALQPKELWLVEGGVHCALYDRFPEEYAKRVFKLLDQVESIDSSHSPNQRTQLPYKHFGSYA